MIIFLVLCCRIARQSNSQTNLAFGFVKGSRHNYKMFKIGGGRWQEIGDCNLGESHHCINNVLLTFDGASLKSF